MSQALIRALHTADCFDHPVKDIEVHETHISWIVLTGDYAYKIKKPLDFGSFLDFSTLERRKILCEQEVRLNRRLAPTLYLDAVAISGTPEAPRIGDDSAVFEYAVKMLRFGQDALLTTLPVTPSLADRIAELVSAGAGAIVDVDGELFRLDERPHHVLEHELVAGHLLDRPAQRGERALQWHWCFCRDPGFA